jgi:hypothetical protein
MMPESSNSPPVTMTGIPGHDAGMCGHDETAYPTEWPGKFTLVQSPRCQPDAHAVVHQNFDAVGASVGKEVGRMRVGSTKHPHHAGQRCVRASSHVHGSGGQPDGIDADHLK